MPSIHATLISTKHIYYSSLTGFKNMVSSSGDLVHVYRGILARYVEKLKLSHKTPWRRRWERKCSSYSFMTSALDGGEWSASRPGGALPPGKRTPVLIGQEAGWASELVWTQRLEEESFRLCRESNLNRPVVQCAVRHYTD
jgi:hypothetical protein